MHPRRHQGDTHLAGALALAMVLVAATGCVTTYEDAPLVLATENPTPFAVSQSIPFSSDDTQEERRLLAEFYGGVLQRMHAAAKDATAPNGDVAELEALLASHERPDLPAAIKDRLANYRMMARGLRFRQHARAHAVLTAGPANESAPPPLTAGAPPLGSPLRFELQLPAAADPVVLGGRDDEDPAVFAVAVNVEDAFAEGGSRSTRTQDFVWLPGSFDLRGNAVLRLPIAVDLPAANAVRRAVSVRVDLMPGYVKLEAGRAPVPLTSIAAVTINQWPIGYEAIAASPLAALREGLRTFGPGSFARVFLAAQAVEGAERDTAAELLVEQVRFGRSDQAQVAMACLRNLTGVDLPIGDRQGWLAWWQSRR